MENNIRIVQKDKWAITYYDIQCRYRNFWVGVESFDSFDEAQSYIDNGFLNNEDKVVYEARV